jgi:hypothetical protein
LRDEGFRIAGRKDGRDACLFEKCSAPRRHQIGRIALQE